MHTDIIKPHLKIRKHGQHANCTRCSGFGYISCYRHIMNGVCFQCLGSGDSKQPLNLSTSSLYVESVKRRWFIGLLKNGNNLEQIFAFTADSVDEGNARVHRELTNMSLAADNWPEHFELCIGDAGQDRKTALAKYQKSYSVLLN